MSYGRPRRHDYITRAGALVVGSTLVLSASFVGLVALATGGANGTVGRLPFYVLVMATAFVAAVVVLEESRHDGGTTLSGAVAVALASFVVVGLGGEGVVYAAAHPDEVIASDLLFYFLAAGLIGTGLGYWGLHHWRELAVRSSDRL